MFHPVKYFLIVALTFSQVLHADCIRDRFPLNFGEQPGVWFGLPAGMGEYVLKCTETARVCPSSTSDGYGLATVINAGGQVNQKITITRVQLVGRDAKLVKLKLKIQKAYKVYKDVSTPVRLKISASSFTGVPEELFVYSQCPLPELADLDVTIKVTYRIGWGNGKNRTSLLKIKKT